MKYPQLLFFLALLLSILPGCKDETKTSKTPNQQDQKEVIQQTLTAMWDAIEKEDLEGYASYIHPDFTQFGETDTILREGKEAEIKGIAAWLEASDDIHTEMQEPRVTVKGDVAWIVYYWQDHGTTDGEVFETRGKSTRIFVKENNKWLCIHGHYTLIP